MAKDYLGIDVSKAKVDVFLLREDRVKGRVFENSTAGFSKMQRWLAEQKVKDLHSCMEATGTYWEAVAAFLFNAGFTVSVVNPACISAFSKSQLRRTKTDQVDAKVIAEFCRAMTPRPWSPPPAHLHELQGLVRRLESLQDMRLQESNRLAVPGISETVAQSIHTVIDALDFQIKEIKEQIKDHINKHPDLKNQRDLLISIPGIGDTTAAALLAEIDIETFSSARQLAAQAGLTPRRQFHPRKKLSFQDRQLQDKESPFPACSSSKAVQPDCQILL